LPTLPATHDFPAPRAARVDDTEALAATAAAAEATQLRIRLFFFDGHGKYPIAVPNLPNLPNLLACD